MSTCALHKLDGMLFRALFRISTELGEVQNMIYRLHEGCGTRLDGLQVRRLRICEACIAQQLCRGEDLMHHDTSIGCLSPKLG